jgi:hypothetical protein
MTVFISHASGNKPEFENIAESLKRERISYWDPLTMSPGASLRDQLREAVLCCSACIFIATRESVASSWCLTELGAFWATRKPIVVHVAEPSLADEELPEILRGDMWERSIPRLMKSIGKIVANRALAETVAGGRDNTPLSQVTLGELLEKLGVAATASRAAYTRWPVVSPSRTYEEDAPPEN